MELVEILRTLRQQKLALVAVAVVAFAIAVLSAYSVSPSGIEKRSQAYGTAQAQILVDSPQSALANLKQDTIPLSTRAGVFAQFMASSAVRRAVAEVTGIPASKIVARGPFDDPAVAPAGTQVAAPPQPPEQSSSVAARPYQLTFVAQEELPLVTVYAQAPSAAQAQLLADGVAVGVKEHVSQLQEEGELDPKHRVVIRSLGPAQAGTVNGGSALPLIVGVFGVIALLGIGAILVLVRLRGRDGDREPVDGELGGLITTVDVDDEPEAEFVPAPGTDLFDVERGDRVNGERVNGEHSDLVRAQSTDLVSTERSRRARTS